MDCEQGSIIILTEQQPLEDDHDELPRRPIVWPILINYESHSYPTSAYRVLAASLVGSMALYLFQEQRQVIQVIKRPLFPSRYFSRRAH